MEKKYAPILIPTLCRDEHFIRCIESLKKNTWAKYTDVYIGLDYPPSEKYVEGYNKICNYLNCDNFNVFASFNIIKRKENYGAFKNMNSLMEFIKDKYPFFVITDDDVEFSVNYLEYINTTLWYYKDDVTVLGVTGYSYPINWKVKEGCNTFKMNFLCPTWGTAFYTNRYILLKKKMRDYYKKNIKDIIKNKKYRNLTDARLVDFSYGCFLEEENLANSMTDIGISIIMTLCEEDTLNIISPIISKVRNYGFDGTGLNCQNIVFNNTSSITAANYSYSSQPIDNELEFVLVPDNSTNYKINKELLNQFDCRDKKQIYGANFRIILFNLLGKKGYNMLRKIYQKLKHTQ